MSSKRRRRRKACAGKIPFPDQTAAVAALISLQRKHGEHSVRSYHCSFCHHWHIGHYRKQVDFKNGKG